ncbi:MAG TPA: hypothetical protein VF834_14435 [Streptosporangiaceae bacterium]
MQHSGSSARASWSGPARAGGAVALVVLLALAAGCTHATSPGTATRVSARVCGNGKTAAGVPVKVEVIRGTTTCATALDIENAYASAIRSGQAPGNGGGGPVKVKGWTCKGFATPVVLKTGNASECTLGGNAILAILELAKSPST